MEVIIKTCNVLISTAAEITEEPEATGEERTGVSTKPANGTAEGNSKSQSGSNKKVETWKSVCAAHLQRLRCL